MKMMQNQNINDTRLALNHATSHTFRAGQRCCLVEPGALDGLHIINAYSKKFIKDTWGHLPLESGAQG